METDNKQATPTMREMISESADWCGLSRSTAEACYLCLLLVEGAGPRSLWLLVSFLAPKTAATATAKSLQSCLTLCDPTRLPRPWGSPGQNTGVGCHFLLQCMEVKSEKEVTQSCPTPHDPMDCSPSGSSVHGIFQARVLEWGASAFSGNSADNTTNY